MIIFSLLSSFLLIIPILSFAQGEHGDSSDRSKESWQKFEGGSSAMKSPSENGEYADEDKEEGSFSYKRHGKNMKREKSMKGGMEAPAEADPEGKMQEGSGKR